MVTSAIPTSDIDRCIVCLIMYSPFLDVLTALNASAVYARTWTAYRSHPAFIEAMARNVDCGIPQCSKPGGNCPTNFSLSSQPTHLDKLKFVDNPGRVELEKGGVTK
jgi:hypothetical protein